LYEVPKDPVTSGNAENGVFAYVQPDAARSRCMSGSVDVLWTGSWSIPAGDETHWSQAGLLLVIVVPVLDRAAGGEPERCRGPSCRLQPLPAGR
jgi:hypothetical protein